jgi:hypothetical protein
VASRAIVYRGVIPTRTNRSLQSQKKQVSNERLENGDNDGDDDGDNSNLGCPLLFPEVPILVKIQ